jgi:uncharacterized membrane protein YdbT with pleckstrin-like domain
MSYISRRLAPGETILHRGRFHFVQEIWPWVALLVLGILVIGIIIWLVELVRMNTTQMAVTNRRVLLKRGFFVVRLDELTLGSIEGSHIHQSIFGRMFGYGRLTLQGRGDTHLQFPTMDGPSRFRAAIEQARMQGEAAPVEIVEADETRGERKRRLRAERERHAHH